MSSSEASRRLTQIKNTINYQEGKKLEVNQRVERSELTPIHFLSRTTLVYPNKTAVVFRDQSYTYSQLNSRVLKLAYLLKTEYGIERGDKVGVLMRNVPVMFESQFSIPMLRGVIVAINTRLNQNDVSYIVEHSGCKVVLVEEHLQDLVANINKSCKVVLVSDNFKLNGDSSSGSETIDAKFEQLKGKQILESEVMEDGGHEDDVISISYTSGTTGRPKGVMGTYRGVTLAAVSNVMACSMNKESSYLWILPLFHCNGWTFPWSVVSVAGCNVLLEKVDPEQIWKVFNKYKVTHYCAAPTVQIMLSHSNLAHPLQHKAQTMIAGSAPSPNLIAKLESLNITPLHAYGLTETYGPCTLSEQDVTFDQLDKATQHKFMARQGFSYPLADPVRVVDANMNDVPNDGKTVGEVVFRGNMVMKGYYNDPEATQKAFQGGFFHTGDLAYKNANGSISLVDRSKDIIISGGENISTIEIENVLADHKSILELAVVPAPHPKWGETPVAFVVLEEKARKGFVQNVLENEIFTFAKQNLARFKRPTQIFFVDALPKTGTGKVQKFVLKQKLWNSKDKMIN